MSIAFTPPTLGKKKKTPTVNCICEPDQHLNKTKHREADLWKIFSVLEKKKLRKKKKGEEEKCYIDKCSFHKIEGYSINLLIVLYQHDAKLFGSCHPSATHPALPPCKKTWRSSDTWNIFSLTLHNFDFFSQRHPKPFCWGMCQKFSCTFIAWYIRYAVFWFCFLFLWRKINTIISP